MGNTLRINRISIIVLILLLIPALAPSVYGQISVTDSRSFEVSFTKNETERTRSGIRLSIDDRLLLRSVGTTATPERFTSASDRQRGFFYVDTMSETSIGSYYRSTDDNLMLKLPFRNSTEGSFEKISVAFDFVFLPVELRDTHTFQLGYRVNNGDWIEPREGQFSTDFLRSEVSGWNTFSLQIALNQIYLRPDDQIELRWTARDFGGSGLKPLAIQKVELNPTTATPKRLRPGSLIVTEILPRFRSNEGHAEYIEIYNSTEHPINLKGLSLTAGDETVVVQHDLELKAYGTVVLANYRGFEALDNVVDYYYPEQLLGSQSGRVELYFDEFEIAKAMYEAPEPGVAVELDHFENAYDGYSGIRHFTPSRTEFNRQISGTPGTVEKERQIFTRTFDRRGWYLFNSPGTVSASLNRDLDGELREFAKPFDSKNIEELQPPYLFFHEEDRAVTLYSSGSETRLSEPGSLQQDSESGFRPLRHSFTRPATLSQIRTARGSGNAFPALLTWSNELQRFMLNWHESDSISVWSAKFIPGINEQEYQTEMVEPGEQEDEEPWTGLMRAIEFELKREGGQTVSDRALIGFWDSPSDIDALRFNLPKLWDPLDLEKDYVRSSKIYLKSSDTEHPTNSYLNFDYTPDDVVQLMVGIRLGGTGDRYEIRWNEVESLPDHWDIEFVDIELNEVVNMRRESSYSFTEGSEVVTTGMENTDLAFSVMEQTDYSRFVVRVSASGALGRFEREDESPDSIELKQNYPNPFNPSTTIAFYIPNSSHVRVGVYNVVGQQVGMLIDDRLSAGDHNVSWNAIDMPSGVYIVQLEVAGTVKTRKITLIK